MVAIKSNILMKKGFFKWKLIIKNRVIILIARRFFAQSICTLKVGKGLYKGHISIFLFTHDFAAWVLESIPSSIQSITANRLYAMKLLKKQEKSPFTARKSKPADKNGISQRQKDQACISCMKWTLLLGSLWKVKHRMVVTTSKNQTLHEVIRKCKFEVFPFRFYIF